MRELDIPCVLGNHDAAAAGLRRTDDFPAAAQRAILWTRERQTADNTQYLASLPLQLDPDPRFTIVHAGLYPQPNCEFRIRNTEDARANLQVLASRHANGGICFFGHTHGRAIYELLPARIQISDLGSTIADAQTLPLLPDHHYLINPGSVGQSRDEDARASFAIYDAHRHTIQFLHVEYDRAQTLNTAANQGLIRRPLLARARSLMHRAKPAGEPPVRSW
jgi:diadenosine tetraphosphatase ApaH/serine/threonine PP2A family protein phosphatase